ncbi:MAG: PIG-L family deacetylase [Cyclobacteriaceae bacterium]|jgi:LmbE family N-acetylglucosaminyl deacetylase|nr:PIG-L family deacetylase [Cytophagales bacterium]MCZ8327038.1 PIG-L family deacetylase [Cyclobacteriaceae bacterium]
MRVITSVLLLSISILSFSQPTQPPGIHTGYLKQKIKKLNFLGSVLYVAAHPDDENTRAITYFANGQLATTAYLSMTRGDGGQNLIGPEIRDELGLIRTQELLAARRIDGGQQFFTRANDFGFSKSATETFSIWGKDEILSDVVRIYRQFQPDVIITRFPPDERAGHGHHTASAMLAQEAFDMAANVNLYSDQLKVYKPWQAKRIYINTGRWWNQTVNEKSPGVITVNVGGYSGLLGNSYTEIAAVSRSQHKSQGFGSRGTRGDQVEFLEHVKGETATTSVFDGVDTSWRRIKGGELVQPLVTKLIQGFNEEKPEASVVLLVKIHEQILQCEAGVWRDRKVKETEELIKACLGLYAEAISDQFWSSDGYPVLANMELIMRAGGNVQIKAIKANNLGYDTTVNLALQSNKPLQFKTKKELKQKSYSDPYWLQEEHTQGIFKVPNESLIGKPEAEAPIQFLFELTIEDKPFTLSVPLLHRTVDPVKGELLRQVEIVPAVVLQSNEPVWLLKPGDRKEITITAKSTVDKVLNGKVMLTLPTGWQMEPAMHEVNFSKRGEEVKKKFILSPSGNATSGLVKIDLQTDNLVFNHSLKNITYDHIPVQTLLPHATANLVFLDIKTAGKVIGYVKGAGDDVPQALRNLGYEVWEMKNEEITPENLKKLDAVVLGVRALNTNERIKFVMKDLLKYVEEGGTMLVQYNTNFDLETDVFSPYSLTLSRDRVTEENAEVKFLIPDHPVMNFPNKVTPEDFNGWVQERGLYFPGKWDNQFKALLSMHDVNESPKEGSLLVAQYGKGQYIYTGLSFFRELPEGVSGAYKLLANLVSAGKQNQLPPTEKIKKKK